jgi:hypothetical protein
MQTNTNVVCIDPCLGKRFQAAVEKSRPKPLGRFIIIIDLNFIDLINFYCQDFSMGCLNPPAFSTRYMVAWEIVICAKGLTQGFWDDAMFWINVCQRGLAILLHP